MRFPIWPCFGWGLPCRPCYHVRGELLPRRFTLAVPGFPGLGRSILCCTFRRLRLAAYSARPLAGILLCEARTFLPVLKVRSGCLTDFPPQLYAAPRVISGLQQAQHPAQRWVWALA